jgi:short subunit dehydrogenase-like uncharacterized protein
MKKSSTIAVFGATGRTGRFAVAEIERRGLRAVRIGRDARKLALLEGRGRIADVGDAATLDAAIADAGAVINCAGPFLDTAIPVLDAALRAKIPYVDVSAEQASVRTLFETRHAAAREAGVPVLPAAAFFGGLADLLASVATEGARGIDEINVAVGLDSWRPTEGTRLTGRRNTATRLVQRDGRLTPMETPAPAARWTFASPLGPRDVLMLPFSEIITLASHLEVDAISSWINIEPVRDIRDPSTPPPHAVDALGRSAQRFVMDVVVRTGAKAARATATGVDIYYASAPIAVEAAERLKRGEAAGAAGVFALGAAFDARDFLRALENDCFAVTFNTNREPHFERENTDAR